MDDKEMQLNLSDQTCEYIKAYSEKTNRSEEEVVEYILREFIANQYHLLEKKAKELNKSVEEIVDIQVAKIAETLNRTT